VIRKIKKDCSKRYFSHSQNHLYSQR